jgi:hypothetical protein
MSREALFVMSGWPRQAALLLILGLIVLAPVAKADNIVLGVLSFDSIIPDAPGAPGVNGFTIYNFTGPNAQPGTPGTAISFLNSSLLLNGSQLVNIGQIDPGSVQPLDLQFPSTNPFTDATLSATLSKTLFAINGKNYFAAGDQLTGDLQPLFPPDLTAGTDFALLSIEANPVASSPVPEPAYLWLVLAPLALLMWRSVRPPVLTHPKVFTPLKGKL